MAPPVPLAPAAPIATRWCDGLAEFAAGYDGCVVDQFGVLHDGHRPYPGAAEALRALRAHGLRVIVLSNSGKRAVDNAPRLARFGATPDTYDRLITSGELTWELLADRSQGPFAGFGNAALLLHPDDDRGLIAGLGLREATSVVDADFLLLASLGEDQTPERLQSLLAAAALRKLPMICANPDRLRLMARGVAPAAGAVAARFAEFGGVVHWVGKPHPLIYTACRAQFERWGARRLMGIGDSLEHDVAGAAAAGFDSCFIAGGIHGAQFTSAGAAGRDALLQRLLNSPHADPVPAPTWGLPTFRWNSESSTT